MSDEDILRRILHEEALAVHPEGSFADVEHRLGSTSKWLASVAAAAVLALMVGAVALVAAQDDETDVTTTPSTDVPSPTTTPPSTALDPAPESFVSGEGIFPFTTGAEADDWAADDNEGVFFDPRETARRFLEEYVGMTEPILEEFTEGDSRSGEIVARARDNGPDTVVLLRQLGKSGAWTVIGAATDSIRLETPVAMGTLDLPAQIRGESCCTFEGNVAIQVKEDGQVGPDQFLGQEPLTGGSMGDYQPLRGEVAYARPRLPGGAVVAFTTSPEDGTIDRVTAVKVSFGTNSDPNQQDAALPAGAPLPQKQMVAVRGGPEVPSEGEHRLVVIDASDGSVLRELATWGTAEGGILDVALTPDRRSVLYTASTSACTSELRALSSDGHGDRSISGQLTTPYQFSIHPGGHRIAVSTDDDCDGQSELVVRDIAGGASRSWPDASPGETGADALLAAIHSIAWVDADTLALGMNYEDGTTIRIHELADADLEVGAGQDFEAGGEDSYLLPITLRADGWIGAVRSCCGTQRVSNSVVRLDINSMPAEYAPIAVPSIVQALGWLDDEPVWVTQDLELQRLIGDSVVDLARGVLDFAV